MHLNKLFEVQADGRYPKSWITWQIAQIAYREYVKQYGDGQTLEDINVRGGFSWSELEH